jgi:hypothetical protein
LEHACIVYAGGEPKVIKQDKTILFLVRRSGAAAALSRRNPEPRSILEEQQNWIDSRLPWRSRHAPPAAFALAILPTQSGSTCDEAAGRPGMTAQTQRLNAQVAAVQ